MRLRFEDCAFDADTREVIRDGRPLAISPKAFALLEFLIEARPRAVSKAEIHDHLWRGIHVAETNLWNLVVELRAALKDDPHEPRIIRTVPRYGYAFSAAATEQSARGRQPSSRLAPAYRLVWGRREISLEPGENLIGRDREAIVWIDDDSVSRRHARVSIEDGSARIEDLGSKNGTYVRGVRISGQAPLHDRDVVKIGPATLRLRILKSTGPTRSTLGERAAK